MTTVRTRLRLIIPLLAFVALAPVASAALLVDYKFDEGSGTTADNTGTLGAVADGTLSTGAGWSTDTPSGSGSSLSVDGADGSGGVSTAAALTAFNGLNTMTGVVWLNPTAVADQDRILSNQGFSGGFVGFDFQIGTPNSGVIAADNYKLRLTINNDATPTSTADVTVSGWQFLEGVMNFPAKKTVQSMYIKTSSLGWHTKPEEQQRDIRVTSAMKNGRFAHRTSH